MPVNVLFSTSQLVKTRAYSISWQNGGYASENFQGGRVDNVAPLSGFRFDELAVDQQLDGWYWAVGAQCCYDFALGQVDTEVDRLLALGVGPYSVHFCLYQLCYLHCYSTFFTEME